MLLKSYKTEIKPTKEQMIIINKTIGVCRFVYNFYLAHNPEVYNKEDYKKLNKIMKGEATRQNIQKQKLKVQKLYHKLDCIRTDYINKIISELVKTKPSWMTIEDLNIKGMMKNKHLSKAIAQQKFYEFRNKLTAKSKEYGFDLRIADRFYPSSKTCSNCGHIKTDLKLSERTYICPECGFIIDRDFNASLNLRDCKIYSIA